MSGRCAMFRWSSWCQLSLLVAFCFGAASVAGAELPRTGLTNPNPVWGFADLHAHQFSNEGFGGNFIWGRSTLGIPNGAADEAGALSHCTEAHGVSHLRDLFGIVQDQGFAAVGGYPEFDGWPRWSSINHQTMYVDWLKRAYDGGLRLMVMLAVNNKLVCQRHLAGQKAGYNCEDMFAVDKQLQAARDVERFVDMNNGGPGRGWYRIVNTPAEARAAIEANKLAVVLGIEVDDLFNCTTAGNCNVESVRRDLKKYYEMGVRHLFPAHVFDNGFGGAALYNGLFNIGNNAITGDFFDTRDCSSEGYEFSFSRGGLNFCAGVGAGCTAVNAFACLAFPLNLVLCPLTIGYGVTGACVNLGLACAGVPVYSERASCNTRGLTSLGDSLIKLMIGGHMIIDIDHMSSTMTGSVLDLVESKSYPVVAGHTGFVEISKGAKKAEGNKTKKVMERLQKLGALVAPILNQGSTKEIASFGDPNVPFPPCGKSSWSWAQAYLYAVDAMKGAPIAFGSDFNGFVQQPAPRYRQSLSPNYTTGDACGGDADEADDQPEAKRLRYPFRVPGIDRSFDRSNICQYNSSDCKRGSNNNGGLDYNVEGLAHVGLLPDFIADLQARDAAGTPRGLTDEQLEPFFHSAEAYIELWERAERSTHYIPTTSHSLSPPPDAGGWNRSDVTVTLRASNDPEGWRFESLTYAAAGVQAISTTTITSPQVALKITTNGVTMITFHATDELGNQTAETAIVVRLDKTGFTPTVTATASPTPSPTATPRPCGGLGQRACCILLDGLNACESGLTAVDGCAGNCLCGGFNPFGIRSSGTCAQLATATPLPTSTPTPRPTVLPGACGEAEHRGCCLNTGEGFPCSPGLTRIGGCTGNCLCGGNNPGGVSTDDRCVRTAPCGGVGQRSCCSAELIDGAPCASGLVEVPGCTGDCLCGGSSNLFEIPSTGHCVAPAMQPTPTRTPGPIGPCGGAGQRACCPLLDGRLLLCDSGLTEVPGCEGDCLCGGFNPFGIQATSSCAQLATPTSLTTPTPTPRPTVLPGACGEAGHRGCCLNTGEGFPCGPGFTRIGECTGDCLCGGNNPGGVSTTDRCIQTAPCGGAGQRSCCDSELINGAPCTSGLVEVPGCTGDCLCGGSSNLFEIPSSGHCVDAAAQPTATATPTPTPLGACGGAGQRACCVVTGEAQSWCASGLTGVDGCTGDCVCGGNNPQGLYTTYLQCVQTSRCGGLGQRSCCAEERTAGAGCASGLVESPGCTGDCLCGGPLNPASLNSDSHCMDTGIQPTATPTAQPTVPPGSCGGAGERACCIFTGEAPGWCTGGLTEISGCTGDCLCGGNNPEGFTTYLRCVQAAPCGGFGERACCAGELIGGAAPCENGLAEVPGCAGDCLCGGGSNPANLTSRGRCAVDNAEPTPTPTLTEPIPPPTLEPVCLYPCAGDCNGDCQVTIDELVSMTSVALGQYQLFACILGDANFDQQITINELVLGVNRGLLGCPLAQL